MKPKKRFNPNLLMKAKKAMQILGNRCTGTHQLKRGTITVFGDTDV